MAVARAFMMAVMAASCLCSSRVHSADIIVVGDSWGTVGAKQFQQVAQNHNMEVDNIAIGGSTAAQWATEEYLLKIFEAVARSKEAKYIWLTVGGNDILGGLGAGTPMEQLLSKATNDTMTILQHVFDNAKDIQVVQFGYDIPNYDTSLSCLNKVAHLALDCRDKWNNVPSNGFNPFVECSNNDNVQLQLGYVDRIAQEAEKKKWAYTGLNFLGLFQYFGGVPGAQIGQPNMQQYSPSQYWLPDCTHPSPEGFTELFYVFWEKYFPKTAQGLNRTRLH